MLTTLPLDMIENGQRLRGISEATVASLINSISDVGLLNPISVYNRKLLRGGEWVDGYGLVAGLHRKTACERLGLVEIEANVLELSDLECQIAECDENLCAPALSPSERAQFTKRRKDAYEALHPETKHGANYQSGQFGHTDTPAFVEATADATGASERVVRRDAERGEKVDDAALALVRGTGLDNGKYLDKLKSLPRDEQVAAVKSDLAALKQVRLQQPQQGGARSKIDADVKARAAKAVAEWIVEHASGEEWDFLKSNLYAAGASNIAHELTNFTGQSIMARSAA